MPFTGFPKSNSNRKCNKVCTKCNKRFDDINMGCRTCQECGGKLTKIYGASPEEWIVMDKLIKKHKNTKVKDLIEHIHDLEKCIKALEGKLKQKNEIIEKLTKSNTEERNDTTQKTE